jgi:integrase
MAVRSLAGLRDAAIATVCFYCVRRSAEALALEVMDVDMVGECFRVTVHRQKNDPNGRGMTCWLPKMQALGQLCPQLVLNTWLVARSEHWNTGGPLFCVTNADTIKAVSYDSWRKSLTTHFKDSRTVGSHSLRKGGASWMKFQAMLPEEVVQAQGGWASMEVMRNFYASFPEEAQRIAVTRGFERAAASL